MIFTFRNKIRTLTNKTSLLLVNILFFLCFCPFATVNGYSQINSGIKNPKIFRLCESLNIFGSAIIASDNEVIIIRSDKKLIGIDSTSLLKIWNYEIPGEFFSEPKLENKKLTLETVETIEKEEITANNIIKKKPVQIIETVINIDTGIPLEVKKIRECTNYSNKNQSKINYRENVNLKETDDSDIPEINSDYTISRDIGNSIVLGYKNGEIILLNKLNKLPVWKTKIGGEVTNIAVLNTGIIITSKDNFLYFLNSKNANKIWKKRMSGRILKVITIDADLAAVIDSSSNKIQLIDIDSGINTGTLMRESESEVFEIKRYSKTSLILLSMSGISLYSDTKCENQKV